MPTENRSNSNHGTRTFTIDSLTAALEQVQALHEISADLIAENVFGQPAQQGQGEPVAWLAKTLKGGLAGTLGFVRPYNRLNPDLYEGPFPVFRHADPAEVERLRHVERDLRNGLKVANGANRVLFGRLAGAQALLSRIIGKRDACLASYWFEEIEKVLSASAEPSTPNDCAICRGLGNQCMECEEREFREWADRHFAAADYRKTDAGVFIQDWMRHAYSAWCARGALGRKS